MFVPSAASLPRRWSFGALLTKKRNKKQGCILQPCFFIEELFLRLQDAQACLRRFPYKTGSRKHLFLSGAFLHRVNCTTKRREVRSPVKTAGLRSAIEWRVRIRESVLHRPDHRWRQFPKTGKYPVPGCRSVSSVPPRIPGIGCGGNYGTQGKGHLPKCFGEVPKSIAITKKERSSSSHHPGKDLLLQCLHKGIQIRFGGIPANGNAERAVNHIRTKSHSGQGVATVSLGAG